MPNILTRAFNRTLKRLAGQHLSINDISVMRTHGEPGVAKTYRARRQFGSNYWTVYHNGLLVFDRFAVASGLTAENAISTLEKIENGYSDKLRGKTHVPYNHYSKIRTML